MALLSFIIYTERASFINSSSNCLFNSLILILSSISHKDLLQSCNSFNILSSKGYWEINLFKWEISLFICTNLLSSFILSFFKSNIVYLSNNSPTETGILHKKIIKIIIKIIYFYFRKV